MKRYVPILMAAAVVLVLSLAYAVTIAESSELNNGITYFELVPDCAHAAGIAMGGAAGPITEVRTSNEVTLFEPVQHIYGMGECVNVMAEESPAPVNPDNGVTYFELR